MVKKFILPNGLRVIFVPQSSSMATTVLILVEAGSEYETRRTSGISHFLEHLVFKGTTKRPKAGMIAHELDSLGAEYNAFTSQEYTGYWAKVRRGKAAQILELVSDLYLDPTFNPEEIEKERGVVIEEINMYEDTPMRRVHDLFTSLLYGDQPAGWDVAGRKEVIRVLRREDFLRYRAKHYVARGTLVVVAGSFDPGDMRREIAAHFGNMTRKAEPVKPKTRERQSRPALSLKFKESDQSHLVLGVRAFDVFDDRKYALELLANLLGGGMSSRLFHRVREEMGAAYYIRANTELFLDHGYLAVSAGVDHGKIADVIRAVLEECTQLKRELVSSSEFRKAQEHMIGTFLLGLETSEELASFYGGQEILTRRIVDPKVVVHRVNRVTAEDIRRLSRDIFTDGKLNCAVIGPYKKEALFRKNLAFRA